MLTATQTMNSQWFLFVSCRVWQPQNWGPQCQMVPTPPPYYSTEMCRSLISSLSNFSLFPRLFSLSQSPSPRAEGWTQEIERLELCFQARDPWENMNKEYFFSSFPCLTSCAIVHSLYKFLSYLFSPLELTDSLCLGNSGQSHLIQLILTSENKCQHTNLIRHGCFGLSWNGDSWLITQEKGSYYWNKKSFIETHKQRPKNPPLEE